MSTIYLMPSGKIATQSFKIALLTEAQFLECCCCPLSLECTENVPTGSYGWSGAGGGMFLDECMNVPDYFLDYNEFPWRISGVFIFADSEECGGPTFDEQSGTARLEFYLPTAAYVTTDTRLKGNVETVNAGYDESRILIDDVAILSIGSRSEHLITPSSCEMADDEDNLESPVALSAGCHSITFETDTGDGRWHKNMRHDFDVYIDSTAD